jgi:ABC-2 type transport system permease protein
VVSSSAISDPANVTAESSALPVRPRHESAFRRNLNLTRELAITAFRLKYTGSVLGYVWSLIKPLLIFGMMYLVFAVFLLRNKSSPGENFPVELLLAIITWTFFADATATTISAIAGNGHMISKVYFPRWILVVASTLSAGMTFLVNLALMLVVGLTLHWFVIGWQIFAFPLLVIELYILILGIGLFLSALFVSYRDLGHVWEILSQLLFYGSAIVYPFSLIPVRYQHLVALVPTTQIIEDMRRSLVSTHIPWSIQVLGGLSFVPFLAVAATFALGFVVFNKLSPKFGELL